VKYPPRSPPARIGGLDNRQIARSCSIPHSSVANYLRRAESAGLAWPLPADLSETILETKLFPVVHVDREIPLPEFASMHAQLLRHKHLTLELLWQEYKQNYPEGWHKASMSFKPYFVERTG
jgi:hypothetical protein